MAENNLEEFLAKYEGRVNRALLKDFALISSCIDQDQVEQYLNLAEYEALISYLEKNCIGPDSFKNTEETLNNTFLAGGLLAAALFPKDIRFDFLDPDISGALFSHRTALINQARSSALDLVRYVLRSTENRRKRALELKETLRAAIGLLPTQERAVENYQRMLQAGSLEALRNALRDSDLDDLVRTTFLSGEVLTESQIRRLVDTYRRNMKTYRRKQFARTEATRLYHVAQTTMLQKLINDGVIIEGNIKKFWVNQGDGRVRNAHVQIPYMNRSGIGFGESFISPLGMIKYPGDPSASYQNTVNCRCYLRIDYDDPSKK